MQFAAKTKIPLIFFSCCLNLVFSKIIVTEDCDVIYDAATPTNAFSSYFTLTKKIDTGGYGHVFACESIEYPHCKYAVKRTINPMLHSIDFKNESVILEKIAGVKYFPKYYGFVDGKFAGDKNRYLFLELVKGMDLHTLLSMRMCSAEKGKIILAQLAVAIQWLHSNNIIHCDIKTENVMVDVETNDVKVIDFGLSKKISSLSDKFYDCTGTVYSNPAEVYSGTGYNYQIDWFCYGVIVFEMFCFFHELESDFRYMRNIVIKACKERNLEIVLRLTDDIETRVKELEDIKNDSFFCGINWDLYLIPTATNIPNVKK